MKLSDVVQLADEELAREAARTRVQYLSAGTFAKVYVEAGGRDLYRTPRVFAIVDGYNHDKDIAADAHNSTPENPHLPAVSFVGPTVTGQKVYTMPLYYPLKDEGSARDEYKTLNRCVSYATMRLPDPVREEWRSPTASEQRAIALECASPSLSRPVQMALQELVHAAEHYSGNYYFDTPPRNVAEDADGNLVLLDVLYDQKEEGL